jgi:hypothetical protein
MRAKYISILFLAVIFITTTAGYAHAQWWKDWWPKKKESQPAQKPAQAKPQTEKPQAEKAEEKTTAEPEQKAQEKEAKEVTLAPSAEKEGLSQKPKEPFMKV